MIVYERLASIEKILEEARKLPLSSKVMIDADEMSLLLKEIKVSLPEELKQARWISEERKKIISEAHVEADDIITEAQDKIDEHELVRLAKEKADLMVKEAEAEAAETRKKANETAEAIRKAALEYTDSVLEKVQRNLDGFIDTIIENRRELE
jgi:hypothetical protein